MAVVVIGPKDLPLALRTAGRWMAKVRKVSTHFRSGIDAMVREAELEELERDWKQRNEAIMKAHPETETRAMPAAASAEAAVVTNGEPQSPPPPPPPP